MGLLPENGRRLDPETQELLGLWGQNFGTGTSFAEEMISAGGERGNGITFYVCFWRIRC